MEEKELTIEQSFAEIEEILNKLESNEVTLEDSFLLYQSGMQQIKYCNDLMNAVEQKVQMLNSNGELETFEEV
jgi:exodeoxyribonuclease VII small subunit